MHAHCSLAFGRLLHAVEIQKASHSLNNELLSNEFSNVYFHCRVRHDRLVAHSVLTNGWKATKAKFKWTQLVTLGLLLAFPYQGLRFLSHAYGYSCLILNPVMVWCMPCVFCMLVWLRYLRKPARADGTDVNHSKTD